MWEKVFKTFSLNEIIINEYKNLFHSLIAFKCNDFQEKRLNITDDLIRKLY